MTEFFRHCPGCGRRFHIKLENRKMVHLERTSSIGSRGRTWIGGLGAGVTQGSVVLFQGAPLTIDIEDFQYTYKCSHCGHEWTEHRHEEHKED